MADYKSQKNRMKIKDLYEPFLVNAVEQGKATSTVLEYKTYRKEIVSTLGEHFVDSLRKKDFDVLRPLFRERGITRERHGMIVVRKLLEYASEAGQKLQFYWGEIKLPGMIINDPTYLNPEDIKLIRHSVELIPEDYWYEKREHAYMRNRAMFELALHTGLRVGELISLSWSDFNFDREEIRVRNIKSKKIDTIDCVGATDWLLEYKKYRGDDKCEAVFVSAHDFGRGLQCKRMGINTAQRIMNDWKKRVGVNKFHWHTIRKTYVTELLKQGLTIREVQYLARHDSPQTTMTYYAALEREEARKRGREVMGQSWKHKSIPVFN